MEAAEKRKKAVAEKTAATWKAHGETWELVPDRDGQAFSYRKHFLTKAQSSQRTNDPSRSQNLPAHRSLHRLPPMLSQCSSSARVDSNDSDDEIMVVGEVPAIKNGIRRMWRTLEEPNPPSGATNSKRKEVAPASAYEPARKKEVAPAGTYGPEVITID